MAPITDLSGIFYESGKTSPEPISRTLQYKKITKPLLERQRRARMNRCLDELKSLLVSGLQNEGENIARLEKADILELTLSHIQKLERQKRQVVKSEEEKFKDGFSHCAQEVSRVLATTKGVDMTVGSQIMVHLGHALKKTVAKPVTSLPSISPSFRPFTPPSSPNEYHFAPISPLLSPVNMSSRMVVRGGPSSPMWRPW